MLGTDSEIAGKIKAEQVRAIADASQTTLLANLVCAEIILFSIYSPELAWFLIPWAVATSALAGWGLLQNHFRRSYRSESKVETKSTKSARTHNKAVRASAAMASLWALLPVIVYPSLSVDQQVTLIAIMAGMLGGGALTFYVIPRAMFVWLVLLTTGCAAAILMNGSGPSYSLLVLILVYSAALFKAGVTISKIFIQAQVARFEVSQQSDTIGILLREFSENVSDWLWEISPNGTLMRGKSEFEEALKTPFESLEQVLSEQNSQNRAGPSMNQRSLEPLRRAFSSRKGFQDVVIHSNCSDTSNWVTLSGKPIFNSSGYFVGFRGVASDITQRKQDEERIAFLAHNDALTGLVNRANFSRALEAKFAQADSSSWSVFYLDLDGFKAINDQEGHGTGDLLLGAVATRLKELVSDRDIVARLGGDEFAILSNMADTVQSVSNLAELLIEELSKPYLCKGHILEVGVSIGIAIGPRDGHDVYSMLNNADLALYRAKAEGKGTYRLFELGMDEVAKARRSLENDVRQALKNDEFSICYQPIVSAGDNHTTGFEALSRWNHPERGNVPPSDFIPVAERLGIIPEIGEWVLKNACRAAAQWPDGLRVAVNLSPQQFHSNHIIQTVVDALTESGLEPSRLELEITEGLFMESTGEVLYILRELKSMGVQIAMDDFGTGYSSLSYIMKFPFDKLKIDRSFIKAVDSDDVARNVLEVITNLGEVLNLAVAAEGVETAEQVEMLKAMKCTHYQGYYFGEPLSESDLPVYLLNRVIQKMEHEPSSTVHKRDVLAVEYR